jgi:ATP-dependent helicase/nuclease subunit A
MMARDDASLRQVSASRPDASTWLLANAGSGKTRVLTDRVARLLLHDVEPQRILCLTYTKSAASEMQNRLFKTLGEWAMKPDEALTQALADLGEDEIDAAHLARARRLFARAIEAPGGLRIQTIHSFCATLLRRFPLEAGVSPRFGELDDRSARLLRQEILEEMSDGLAPAAVAEIAREFSGNDFMELIAQIVGKRRAFRHVRGDSGGIDFGAAEQELAAAVMLGVGEWFGDLLAVLALGSDQDLKARDKLAGVSLERLDLETLQTLEGVFLFGEKTKQPFGAKIDAFPTKDRRTLLGGTMAQLNDLMARVEAARERRVTLQAARKTRTLTGFAQAFLPIYEARKAEGGWLDFDDLITKAIDLLTDPSVAAWVLYRLDGGIDHVLVDEAQDTSPAQWRVIELLTAEFTAGQGARDELRTVFVVGDQKQSIYSFQGADVAAFGAKHLAFQSRFGAAAHAFQSLNLEHSFRSSPAILSFVDAALHGRDEAALGPEISHIAFRQALPGRVDLWPLVEPNEKPEGSPFEDPVDLISASHHFSRLAEQIATEIRAMLDNGTMIESREGPRPVHAGDFLILVQSRSDLFTAIIRACKKEGLPIAGADRLKLAAELAVKDLLALLSFLDTPDDNLSLAAVLRSPLCGIGEAELFDLAHARTGNLWESLIAAGARFESSTAFLSDMRGQVDYLRPFDLLERVLVQHDGRRRLVARLGDEAEEAIDELLNQALAYERNDVPSLTGFLIWLDADEIEVKRQAESSGRRIRVMTVHGAKGLESEIVILPDTADHKPKERDYFYVTEDDGPVWKTPAASSPPHVQALRSRKAMRDAEERLRLLYVAMTRARTWLIIAGAGEVRNPTSWYAIAADGMARMGGVRIHNGLRIETGVWPAPEQPVAAEVQVWPEAPITGFEMPGPLPKGRIVLIPSDLGGAKVLLGETSAEEEISATSRGEAIHLLLQHLPGKPADSWPGLASHLILDPSLRQQAFDEAGRVLSDPAIHHLFGRNSLSEVSATAEYGTGGIFGVIDRLMVWEDAVLAVDFKSNTVIPASAEDIPEGILRQLGAYHHILTRLYPDRRVDVAILWTRNSLLMPVDAEIVSAAMQRATRDSVPSP